MDNFKKWTSGFHFSKPPRGEGTCFWKWTSLVKKKSVQLGLFFLGIKNMQNWKKKKVYIFGCIYKLRMDLKKTHAMGYIFFIPGKYVHRACFQRSFTKDDIHLQNNIIDPKEKVNFRSQILERPSIGEYWNISGVPVLPENMIFMFFRMC